MSSVSRSLSEALLSEAVASIVREERSGDLIVESGPHARKILFDRGCVGFAASNLDELRFGDLLLASGRIAKAELDLALDIVKRDRCRIGEAMVASGFLTEDEVTTELARQIGRIATSAYGVREGTHRFDEHECRIPPELRVGVSIYRIQLEGIRELSNPRLIEAALGPVEQYVSSSERAPFQLDEVSFEPTELRVREIARRPISIRDLLNEIGGDRASGLRGVYGLFRSGILRQVERPAERPVEQPQPAIPAPPPELQRGGGEAAGAGRFSAKRGSANQKEITQLFTEIKIRKMVHDHEGVAAMLRKVVALAPDDPRYVGMLARAIASVPARAKDAEPYFRRASTLDPDNAELHYEFGRYYQKLGMPSRALAELKVALRIDPALSKARSAVVELKQREENPLTKSLKKLFT